MFFFGWCVCILYLCRAAQLGNVCVYVRACVCVACCPAAERAHVHLGVSMSMPVFSHPDGKWFHAVFLCSRQHNTPDGNRAQKVDTKAESRCSHRQRHSIWHGLPWQNRWVRVVGFSLRCLVALSNILIYILITVYIQTRKSAAR